MIAPQPDRNFIDRPLDVESAVEILQRVVAGAQLFRSADGRLYAQVPVGERHEIYGVKSPAFRDWMIDGYSSLREEPPSNWAVRRVLAAVEARARFDTGTPSIFVRVGHDGTRTSHGKLHISDYFIDLGDASGQAVKIGPGGWSVVARPGVHFRRPDGLMPLPLPSRDGSIQLLRPFVNLTDADFHVFIAWLAAALRPRGPYPILVLHGEQGSAKSTLATVARLLVDPQSAPLLAEPKSTRDLMVTAVNGWLLAYDNINVIPTWLSDSLCRLAVGGGYAARALNTNDERFVIHAQRPLILNGIEDFVRRGDLADRCVFLNLPRIDPTTRRREDEFWASFDEHHARIFGGLLDALAGGLRELPSVRLKELPRMADYAAFGEAIGNALGWPTGTFITAYNDNRRDATEGVLGDSLLATTLLELSVFGIDGWSNTPTEVYNRLVKDVGKKVAASAGWPKTVGKFTNELRRIAPQLCMHGLFCEFTRDAHRRLITFSLDEPKISSSDASDDRTVGSVESGLN